MQDYARLGVHEYFVCLVLQLALPAEQSALVAFLLGRGRAHYPAVRGSTRRTLHAAASEATALIDDLERRGVKPEDAGALGPIVGVIQA